MRTVQRWEKDDGLPIRRINGTSKIVVQREDLDRWLRRQPGIANASQTVHELSESVARAKQLRSQNTELRASVLNNMHSLLDACRRMQVACKVSSWEPSDERRQAQDAAADVQRRRS